MTRKKTKFCLSWPNKTLKMSGRLWNIAIFLTDRTIMPYWSLIFPLSSLFYRMWRHFSLDDLDTQKVPGVAEFSPPPLIKIERARSASSIWNHKYDFRPKLHDPKFNYHFIRSNLKSHNFMALNFRFWCIVRSRAGLLEIAEPEIETIWHLI